MVSRSMRFSMIKNSLIAFISSASLPLRMNPGLAAKIQIGLRKDHTSIKKSGQSTRCQEHVIILSLGRWEGISSKWPYFHEMNSLLPEIGRTAIGGSESKFVPRAVRGPQETRRSRFRFELLAESQDKFIDNLGRRIILVSPYFLDEFFSGNHAVGETR